MSPGAPRRGGGIAANATALAATSALVAEVVALAARPFRDQGLLGPAIPTALVLLGTAAILALRLRRGIGGTLATAGGVAAVSLAYGGVPVLVPALLTWIAALVAAGGRAQLAGPGAGPRPRLTPAGSAAVRTPARVVAVPVAVTVAVTLVAVALLQLLHDQSPQDAGGAASGRGGSGGSERSPRMLATYAGGSLDLTARGRLSDIPVADVPAASPSLWRTGSLGEYTGRSWEPDPQEGPLMRAGVGTALFGPGTQAPVLGPRFDDGDDESGAASARPRQQRGDVRLVGTSLSWLPIAAPGRLRRVEAGDGVGVVQAGRRAVLLVDAAGAEISTENLDPSIDPDDVDPYDVEVDPSAADHPAAISNYQVTWSPRPGIDGTRLQARAETGDDVDAARAWTQLPDAVPQRVRDLAVRLTRDAADRVEAARAVEAYVNRTAEYTLEGPPLPDGADAADDLLFGSRQGFCEQFATAEAVLLRAVGVPARIATGWAGGEDRGDRRLWRARDAHAWVEVLVPGLGWVSSDPTAGARPAPPPVQDRALDLLRDPRFWLAVGLAVLAAVLAVVAVLVVRRRRRRRPRLLDPAAAPVQRLLAAYALVQEALGRAGLARAPTQTLTEHTESVLTLVRTAGGPPAADDVDAALAAVARLLYGAAPPPDAVSEQGAVTLAALAAAVPRLVEDARTNLAAPGR
jgi:transglutaminase-like putative cysteine protease